MSHFIKPFVSDYFPNRKTPNALFTKKEKKNAKRDYKELQKTNPHGFLNSLKQFRANFIDKISKEKLKFNLKNLIQYLSKLDPEMEVHLDKDGWQGYGDTEVELIETSGLFEPFGDLLFINN